DILALKVAADRRDRERRRTPRGRCGQLAEDPLAQGAEDLGDPDRVAARVALELLVLDALEHAGIEALVQYDFLEVEDDPRDRVVRAAGKGPAILPRLDDQLAEQPRREAEGLVAEDPVDQELEGLALPGAGDGRDGVAGLGRALEVAVDRLAADVLRSQIRAVAELADAGQERAA